jgi:hypothetical protein
MKICRGATISRILFRKQARDCVCLGESKICLPTDSRLTHFCCLVLPLFNYGDVIWGDKNNISLMNDLQVQQSNAPKIILNKPISSSSTEALSTLKWKRLSERRRAHRCIFIFKCLNNHINH